MKVKVNLERLNKVCKMHDEMLEVLKLAQIALDACIPIENIDLMFLNSTKLYTKETIKKAEEL